MTRQVPATVSGIRHGQGTGSPDHDAFREKFSQISKTTGRMIDLS